MPAAASGQAGYLSASDWAAFTAKGSGTIQYPNAIEHGGSLWVIYSVNKEDIEISEIPLRAFDFSSKK